MAPADMVAVAVISNPLSSGNKSLLPRMRAFCARHTDVAHFELGETSGITGVLTEIAATGPRVLAISGGDGTVQAVLTVLGDVFGVNPPPIAVLPSGKTNLIAHDLRAGSNTFTALQRVLTIARQPDMTPHIVRRNMISLTDGDPDARPVLGMFLGGAGLADIILYCRHKIYPMGMSNSVSHGLAGLAALVSMLTGLQSRYLPPRPSPIRISTPERMFEGRYQVVMVTTLHRLLMRGGEPDAGENSSGRLRLLLIERRPRALFQALLAAITGRHDGHDARGFHLDSTDEILIEGEQAQLILDGEAFEANPGQPITLRSDISLPFLRLG
ncbi:MAG: diacylglycerol kinase family protein [Sphingomonadaceae bacterium]